jgi:DNA-binding GntR family transcriptional regulator
VTSFITRTAKSLLVENLRDEILLGELVPGQQIRLEDIAERFEISTTPVREALRELEAEGLVTIYPHRGAIITQLSPDDLLDIYEIRATLESMATRLAVPHVNDEILAKMRATISQMDNHLEDLVTLVKLNHNFHITLYNATGRRHLCELTTMLRYRTQHYLHAFISDLGGMPKAQIEHRVIIKACEQGDAERAAAFIYEHVINVGQAIVEFVRKREEATESIE